MMTSLDRRGRGAVTTFWTLIGGALLVVGTIVFASVQLTCIAQNEQPDVETAADEAAVAQAKGLSRAFRAAARKVIPSVVMIRASMEEKATNPFEGTPYEEWFNDNHRGFGSESVGLGSGVIVDPSGVIVTNNHVVSGMQKIVVELADGRQFVGQEIKVDKESDLAVVRIDVGESLPAARMGDSTNVEIGDWVIAVGNPFDLEMTVSAGIISAKGRSLGAVRRASLLQTDAAINPGNSGGPLVNLDGEVVGINTAIFSRTGGNQGIGFAIPAEQAQWVAGQLAEEGQVRRAYLGIAIDEVDAATASRLDVRPNRGVLVTQVIEDTPADKAGLKREDIIVAFDGTTVNAAGDLQSVVERSEIGKTYDLRIVRDGNEQTLKVPVAAMPRTLGTAGSLLGATPKYHQDARLGLLVLELSDSARERYDLEDKKGVLVVSADPGRPAARAGIEGGALILEVDGKAVKTVEQYKKAISEAKLTDGIELKVEQEGEVSTVRVTQ